MMRQLGGVFGIAVLVAVFTGAGGYGTPQVFSDGFTAALWASAGLSVFGAAAGLGLPARHSEPRRVGEAAAVGDAAA